MQSLTAITSLNMILDHVFIIQNPTTRKMPMSGKFLITGFDLHWLMSNPVRVQPQLHYGCWKDLRLHQGLQDLFTKCKKSKGYCSFINRVKLSLQQGLVLSIENKIQYHHTYTFSGFTFTVTNCQKVNLNTLGQIYENSNFLKLDLGFLLTVSHDWLFIHRAYI